ncbi:MAG: serine acetyltransferase [Methylobacillus glycogenes]|nr:serine acetyltransferase [Methylobacillus glycogenes]
MFIEDLKAHREGLLAQGFWALQVYRFGHARFKYQSKLIRWPWGLIHLVLSKLCEIFFGIYIGVNAKIGRRFVIEHFGQIIIHGETEIGDDCMVRQGVTIGNRHVDYPLDAPVIGSNVNIGAGAKILGKVSIGDNVDIGANAVVIKDVPSNHIAVGVPAKNIQKG